MSGCLPEPPAPAGCFLLFLRSETERENGIAVRHRNDSIRFQTFRKQIIMMRNHRQGTVFGRFRQFEQAVYPDEFPNTQQPKKRHVATKPERQPPLGPQQINQLSETVRAQKPEKPEKESDFPRRAGFGVISQKHVDITGVFQQFTAAGLGIIMKEGDRFTRIPPPQFPQERQTDQRVSDRTGKEDQHFSTPMERRSPEMMLS